MKRFFAVMLMLLAGLGVASAQVVSDNGGSIAGDITDATGAKVPSATVTITSPDTGTTKTVKTDKSGFYSIGPLNPGSYTLTVSADGFETLSVKTVINLGTATPGTFKMTVGSSKETVEVSTGGSVQVDTDQAGVSDVLTSEQLQTLPVNGRNFLDLAQIEPGVILQAGSSFDPTKAGYSAISVSGVSGRTTRILLDGQDITDETVGTTILNVSQGAIGEFQLNRSTQDASGEVTSTGQVLVSTQSGTNKIHGMAFYNFQDNSALFADANVNSINTTTGAPLAIPYFQRNQFGGSVGGPILHDKLFLFANSERIQQVSETPANLGSIFPAINSQYPFVITPYKETYSTGRLDYNGPWGGHYFFRGAYNVDATDRNASYYELYKNRDNTFGFAGGADYQKGNFTHSFRGSYEKFHNLIVDATAGNPSLYDPIAGITLSYSSQVAFGPYADAPQATYQSDKQFRYDGSWMKGQHIVRFGYSLNRILGGGFFAYGALGPRIAIASTTALNPASPNATYNPNNYGCNNVVGGTACTGDPVNGYATSTVSLANGQGAENELPGFGLKNGGQFDWREGAYIQDNWKVTPSFTLTMGLRWSVDTGRANQDLNPILCSQLNTSYFNFTAGSSTLGNPCTSGTTPLFSLWNSSYTGKVHQPYANFGPQLGFAYAPGNHKTVLNAATGIFYENDVFNNASNARSNLLPLAYGYATTANLCANYSLNLPNGTVTTTAPDGTPISTLCHESITAAAPDYIALQNEYVAQSSSGGTFGPNASFIGNTLSISDIYAPNYRTPYAFQYNFGIQHEIRRGSTIRMDYLHNSTFKIGQTLDQNHVGAARTFNTANAQAAINATFAVTCAAKTVGGVTYTVPTSVQQAITPGGCSGGSGTAAAGKYATINDFATNGLDSGKTFNSSGPASYSQKSVNGNKTAQAAFPGLNPELGVGSFITPSGKSAYDALQFVFHQQAAHPAPGVVSSNFQASYSLSRIVATTTSADEFFTPSVIDEDHPTAFMGRSGNDHKEEVSFGGSATLGGGRIKYGPRISLLAHFFSASPSTLALDGSSLSHGTIFQTGVTGDGLNTTAPGTLPGDYMHRVTPRTLGKYISNFNSTIAETLTPAGQAVAASGLITQAQLVQMGAAFQPIAQVSNANGQVNGVFNPTFRQMDAQVSWPIPLSKLIHSSHEGIQLEPVIAFYNVGNFSNFSADTATLQTAQTAGEALTAGTGTTSATTPYYNTASTGNGYITGTNNLATQASKRTVRGIGTFDQGAQRTAEFQLHLVF